MVEGASLVIFLVLCGCQSGWLVDRFSSRGVIGAGVTVWSLSTAASGLAASYWMLLIARIGVGAGEAAPTPAAYSMIPDLFPRKRLAFVMSLYVMGSSMGAGLAYGVGGALIAWLDQLGPVFSGGLPLATRSEEHKYEPP